MNTRAAEEQRNTRSTHPNLHNLLVLGRVHEQPSEVHSSGTNLGRLILEHLVRREAELRQVAREVLCFGVGARCLQVTLHESVGCGHRQMEVQVVEHFGLHPQHLAEQAHVGVSFLGCEDGTAAGAHLLPRVGVVGDAGCGVGCVPVGVDVLEVGVVEVGVVEVEAV